ncbi:MAG: hypothetical protein JWO20_838 [Candidatus Angelobacter sp.]|jgi:uncharacterized membrane protein (DUF373 family)|nr:hypothetical protein [Candidatus Angelobacter sp.]
MKSGVVAEQKNTTHPVRLLIVRGLNLVEDAVYVGLGLLLTITALGLLSIAFKSIFTALTAHALADQAVSILDQFLLILLVVELLYTVQVSFREHGLIAEPFLVVALIATIRRVLILTAEVSKMPEPAVFQRTVIELALLTVMILVLVGSLIMLQKQDRRSQIAE